MVQRSIRSLQASADMTAEQAAAGGAVERQVKSTSRSL